MMYNERASIEHFDWKIWIRIGQINFLKLYESLRLGVLKQYHSEMKTRENCCPKSLIASK